MTLRFWLRKLVGCLERPFYPGFGACYRCGRSWGSNNPVHTTGYCSCTDEEIAKYQRQANEFHASGTGIVLLHPPARATQKGECRGCFPLCEECWRELKTPEARWPYYKQLVDYWFSIDPLMTMDSYARIYAAVREGVFSE